MKNSFNQPFKKLISRLRKDVGQIKFVHESLSGDQRLLLYRDNGKIVTR